MPYSSKLLIPKHQHRRSRLRTVRAMWRDSWALLREFRRPLFAFFLSVFVGGFLYGELLVIAGHERIPYHDLPYIMMALMIFETPTELPYEPQLIVFWYIQPLWAVYIFGRGAADFIRLFFDRSERKNAWEVAVASTYRNHVIVLGLGHVGFRVIRTLVQMGFDVVALDLNPAPDFSEQLKKWDVSVLAGDGRQTTMLKEAGLAHAQSIIICTSDDHVNLEVVMRVRDMNPDIRIVARMWDDRFSAQMKRFMGAEALSASDLAAPAFAGTAVGIEITQTLTIAGEEYSMIRLQVARDSFMDGKTIDVLQDDEDLDIVLYGRNGSPMEVHPKSSTIVHADDTLVLFSRHSKIIEIVGRNRPGVNGR